MAFEQCGDLVGVEWLREVVALAELALQGSELACLFGRLSSHADKGIAPSKGLTAYLLWLDDADLALGATHVSAEMRAVSSLISSSWSL